MPDEQGTPKAPQVTVLMTTYNGKRHIKDAISSILLQSFTDFELLIVNDGSTDNTLDIVQNFSDKRIRVINHECNKGIAEATNTALKLAQGKYIVMMDHDDISAPHRIKTQVDFLEKHPHIHGCGGAHIEFKKDVRSLLRLRASVSKRAYVAEDTVKYENIFGGFIFNPTVCIRADIIRKTSVYCDSSLKACIDTDFYDRLQTQGAKLVVLPNIVLYYRVHTSTSRKDKDLTHHIRTELAKRAALRLIPNANTEELEIHQQIVLRKFKTLKNIECLQNWLLRIATATNNNPTMLSILSRHYSRICAVLYKNMFQAFRMYCGFPLLKGYTMSSLSFFYQWQKRRF